MLVNPTGREGSFRAVDWVVELYNLFIKVCEVGNLSPGIYSDCTIACSWRFRFNAHYRKYNKGVNTSPTLQAYSFHSGEESRSESSYYTSQ